MRLFNRVVRVEVGKPDSAGRAWDGRLRIDFTVERQGDGTPDTAEIRLYNLAPDSRSWLAGTRGLVVRLLAGHAEAGPSLLIAGDLRRTTTRRDGPDLLTTLEVADGGRAWETGVVTALYQGVDGAVIVQDVAQKAGLLVAGPLPPALSTFRPAVWVAHGLARTVIDRVVRSAGLSWTLQDGAVVVTAPGEATGEVAARIGPESGLVGQPEATDDNGVAGVRFTALLNGWLRPRRRLLLASASHSGVYVARRVTHRGDSGFTNDFHTDVEARPVPGGAP